MGYDLHITRADDWSETAGHEIPVREWIDLIDDDAELESDEASGPYAAVWRDALGETRGWFDWMDGQLYTTNPTRVQLGKMLEIAGRLEAKVQGDDLEFYGSPEDLAEDAATT